MAHMMFNGQSLKDKFRIIDIRGRGVVANDIDTIEVAGKAGAYFINRKIPVRIIEVDVEIRSSNNLREDIRNLNAILSVDEPKQIVFSDDEEISYYGIPANNAEGREIVSLSRSRATISFVCVDPYAYKDEKEHQFEFDVTRLYNEGSEEAEPVFELRTIQPVTFAMIQNQFEEYQMIGFPADDDIQAVDTKETVLYENGSTLDQWQHTENRDMINNDSNIDNLDGTMGTDDAGIRAENYGTPGDSNQRGPAVFRELAEAVQDFELETTFDIISNREIENFRMMIYLNDENMNPIGQIGLKDNSRVYKRRRPIAQLGQHNRGERLLGDSSWTNDNARNVTLFYLRMKREGQRFTFYIGEWQGQRHINTWQETFHDRANNYTGGLKYITLFIGSYRDRVTPSRLRMNSVEVFRLQTVTEDQTPYIAHPGDIITFDHQDGNILINGENRKDLKDFGGQYFNLRKGENELVVHPTDSFSVTARYREKYR